MNDSTDLNFNLDLDKFHELRRRLSRKLPLRLRPGAAGIAWLECCRYKRNAYVEALEFIVTALDEEIEGYRASIQRRLP